MQVTLQGVPGLVLGGEHPLPGGPQLSQPITQPRAQPGVGQQQRGLPGQLLDQPAVRAADPLTRALGQRQRADQLALVTHGFGEFCPRQPG